MDQGIAGLLAGIAGLVGAGIGGLATAYGARVGATKTLEAAQTQARQQSVAEHRHWVRDRRSTVCTGVSDSLRTYTEVAHRYLAEVLEGQLPLDADTTALQAATNQLTYSAGQADLWGPDEVASKAQQVASQGQRMTALLRRWHEIVNQGEVERVAHQQACASQWLPLTDARMDFMPTARRMLTAYE
ncbi:hypothetical protein [Streptomyces griseoluteus]